MVLNRSKELRTADTTTPQNLTAEAITDQTVTFHDDRVVDHNMFPGHVPIPDPLLKSVQEERTHDIRDFLGRPSVVDSGVLTTSHVRGDVIAQLILPQDLLLLPMYREKTRGFLNFRATVNLRFQANAQRFQQGRLFITYFPQPNINPKKDSIVFPSLTLSTQLPRVDFDLATDSDVALSIPYVSPTLGYNQGDLSGETGHYRVRVYSPLVSPGGPATVDWTLWAWFTDIELDFPAFTPQSGLRQARKVPPSEMEVRPISTIFKKVTKAATLFTDVPLISSVAGTVAWVSNILGNTASAFGFSNPDAANTAQLSKLNVAHDIANVNAVGTAVSLGLLSDNKVQDLPGFAGTDIDEMSFAYLTKIPSYVANFTWTTSNTAGQSLYDKVLSPGRMSTVSASGPDFVWPTPMAYISNLFEYWRTGFTFTFKFVKTEFHSGRLMVVYNPRPNTFVTFAESRYLYREVLDLRESNEFTITIPYTATIPYMSNSVSNLLGGDNIGALQIFVLNPLVAPTTVSTSIDVIVEVSADNTFEVAVPRNICLQPVMYEPGTGPPTLLEDVEFESQGLGENEQSQSKDATVMMPAPSISGLRNNDGGLAAASFCIGEKIVSLRSLAKRAAPIIDSGTASQVATYFRPKLVSLSDHSDDTTVAADYALDYISVIAPLYNYQRGGLKFVAYCPGNSSANSFIRAGLAPNTLGTTPIIRATSNAIAERLEHNALAIHTGPLVAGGCSWTVPQYSRTHCEMYRLYTANTYTLPTDIYCSDLRVFLKGNTGTNNTRILRQAADDWSCGFFTGVLPIRNLSFLSTTPPATM